MSHAQVVRKIPKKSRNGCQQCKARKVKCDEQAPCCRNCKYRKVNCSYQLQWGQPSSFIPSRYSNPQPAQPSNEVQKNNLLPSSRPPLIPPTRLAHNGTTPLQELELMHHYATTAFAVFADYEVYRSIWQVAVPREAQSYQFLMHVILAISALHISHLRETSDHGSGSSYKELARTQYHDAVVAFRSTVPRMTKSNSSAVFAFSNLTIYFAFGSSKFSADNGRMEDPIGELLDVFTLLRTAMETIRSSWDSLSDGPLALLLQRGPAITDRQYLPPDIAMGLELMEQFCQSVTTIRGSDGTINETYQVAIKQLWDSFVMAETKRKDWSMALRFPIIFSKQIQQSLRRRDPTALVLLAHFCVLLHRAPTRWWADGWSEQVIDAVFRSLDLRWRHAIAWPMRAIGVEMRSIDLDAADWDLLSI
ncbi:C6 zinc finger domain-containing protein [Blastomyces gilchristii SLH14081]|uniref:C6 zinc finger domain-containing protein n=2 Tax=Blastomyces TaxID=229219 RepID=A0A179UMW2_BLAGS|nr:C6 zinc finger domain-containing protein [Blastomyces gilchristii SLH14081]EGE80403.1 C6 transcription factor [Blastomyces dermatitidis ATCC 18188]KMW67264.1 C6 transcription factor, variant [Blastomyces dermatitidis ATCC 18188]OAT09425.1 C6 zinc finger domain-containing protein [Blastomyces gilchristii SLH14081]